MPAAARNEGLFTIIVQFGHFFELPCRVSLFGRGSIEPLSQCVTNILLTTHFRRRNGRQCQTRRGDELAAQFCCVLKGVDFWGPKNSADGLRNGRI
jgi:hypothetical protein